MGYLFENIAQLAEFLIEQSAGRDDASYDAPNDSTACADVDILLKTICGGHHPSILSLFDNAHNDEAAVFKIRFGRGPVIRRKGSGSR